MKCENLLSGEKQEKISCKLSVENFSQSAKH